jgi:hypothetical protein
MCNDTLRVPRTDGSHGAVHDSSSRMTIGVNYPWKSYGMDFGSGASSPPWLATLEGDLYALANAGVKVLRWFMLCDGAAYGRPELDPDPSELWWGQRQWRFTVPRSAEAILSDFRLLLNAIASTGTGLQLLPVVMSCSICYPGDFERGPFSENPRPPPAAPQHVKNGRADLVFDPRKSTVFFDTFLKKLIQLAAEPPYRELVYAFEVMNEPEWCVRERAQVSAPRSAAQRKTLAQQTIPVARMKTFLKDAAAIIRTQFPSTVGFAEHSTFADWGGSALGLDIPQFHYYGIPETVPRCTRDMIIGEFATRAMTDHDRHWRDLGRDQSVLARLCHIESKGYRAAFVWAMRTTDRASSPSVWPQALIDIHDYLQGNCRRTPE